MQMREAVARALNPSFYQAMEEFFHKNEFSAAEAEGQKARSLTHQANLIRADDAILAVLEHLRDNVSEGMLEAAGRVLSNQSNAHDKPLPTAANLFRAMIDQKIKEEVGR